MTLPASGPISLSDIQTEFGGSNPISISEYYAAAAGIPGSGAISFSDFYGTSAGVTVTFDKATYAASALHVSEGLASAGLNVDNDGNVTASLTGTNTSSTTGEWTPNTKTSGNGDDFEVRVSLLSGTSPSGDVVGSWLAMTSDRNWTVAATGGSGTITSSIFVEIRDVTTSTVQDSATFNLSAESQSLS